MRKSNIELLRILAMLMIVGVHATYLSVGAPSISDIRSNWVSSSLLVLQQSFFIVCVNIFVLISGWFGIHVRRESLLKYIYQCLFFSVVIYLVMLLLGLVDTSGKGLAKGIMDCLYLGKMNWFVRAYLLLMIFAPVLNYFAEKASRQELRIVVLGFFVFQTIFDCIANNVVWLNSGNSTLSFMGLYLLARYINIYKPKWSQNKKIVDLVVYLCCVLLTALIIVIPPIVFNGGGNSELLVICLSHFNPKMLNYSSPLVILGALSLLLLFSKISYQNKMINGIAASSFGVFLFHANPNISPYFLHFFDNLYVSNTLPLYYLKLPLYLTAWFIIGILIDQIRKFSWVYIKSKIL